MIEDDQTKSNRGLNNALLARQLCPRKYLDRLNEPGYSLYFFRHVFLNTSPSFLNKLKDGRIKIMAEDWPTFLYDSHSTYNPEDIEVGLMRGHLAVRVRICVMLHLL